MKAPRKLGTIMRLVPDVVRIDVPIRHADDLPQLARELEAMAFRLKSIHQNEQLNANGKLGDAYHYLRAFNRKLKQEYPR